MFKYFLIASTATGLAMGAQAQSYDSDTGFYLDGGYQYLEIEPDGAEQGVDTNGIAARLGYKFNNVFSLEGELASGIDDGEFDYNVDEDEFKCQLRTRGDPRGRPVPGGSERKHDFIFGWRVTYN